MSEAMPMDGEIMKKQIEPIAPIQLQIDRYPIRLSRCVRPFQAAAHLVHQSASLEPAMHAALRESRPQSIGTPCV
jgi:hypothetical protein